MQTFKVSAVSKRHGVIAAVPHLSAAPANRARQSHGHPGRRGRAGGTRAGCEGLRGMVHAAIQSEGGPNLSTRAYCTCIAALPHRAVSGSWPNWISPRSEPSVTTFFSGDVEGRLLLHHPPGGPVAVVATGDVRAPGPPRLPQHLPQHHGGRAACCDTCTHAECVPIHRQACGAAVGGP